MDGEEGDENGEKEERKERKEDGCVTKGKKGWNEGRKKQDGRKEGRKDGRTVGERSLSLSVFVTRWASAAGANTLHNHY